MTRADLSSCLRAMPRACVSRVRSASTAPTLLFGLIAGTLIRFLVVPLARRTSDQRFALYVEERAPELRQSLLSAVHELHAPEELRSSPSLAARLTARTVKALEPLKSDGRIERPRTVRALQVLGGAAVVAALLPAYAGLLLERETHRIADILQRPDDTDPAYGDRLLAVFAGPFDRPVRAHRRPVRPAD